MEEEDVVDSNMNEVEDENDTNQQEIEEIEDDQQDSNTGNVEESTENHENNNTEKDEQNEEEINNNEEEVVEEVEEEEDNSFKFTNDEIKKVSTTSLISLLLLHIISRSSMEVGEEEDCNIDWDKIYNQFIEYLKRFNTLSKYYLNDDQLSLIQSNIITSKQCEIYYKKLKSIYSKDNLKELETTIKQLLKTELKQSIDNLQNDIIKMQNDIVGRDSKISSLSLDSIDQDKSTPSTPYSISQNNNNNNEELPTSPLSVTPTNIKVKQEQPATPVQPSTPSSVDDESTSSSSSNSVSKSNKQEEDKNNNHRIIMNSLQKIWKLLNSHRYASIFRYPITLEEAPDYDEFITHRMDLTTLKKRLEDGQYSNCTEFNTDLQLIFSNAMEYNAQNSEIYNCAVSMKKYADKEMDMVFTTESLLQNTSGHVPLRSSRGSTSTTPSPSIRGRKSTNNNNATTTPTRSGNKKDSAPSTPLNNDDTDDVKTPREESPSPQSTGSAKPKANRRRTSKPAASTPNEQKKTTKRQRTSKTEEKSTLSSDES